MENNDLISIIIPCYNDWQYIEQAINSALNQTYPNKEVIIVDDGSNAKTKEILKRLEPKITKLITQENQGQSKARNVGIEVSKGDYILVLDSDDYFEPSFCEMALSLFLKNNLVKIVTCQAILWYENGSKDLFVPRGGSIINFMYCNNALGTSMFKKEDWLLSGGYDESMRNGFEDWEFFIRILEKEGIAEVIHEPLYNYRKQKSSTTTIANTKKYELLNYIYLKHQELYKNNFDSFVFYMLSRIEREELEKLKNLERIEYKIGKIIVKPIRLIKSIFN
jgi:glycosyltransferase involved in cell wall biosynthesis